MNQSDLQERALWHPQSWRDKAQRHMPSYPEHELAAVTARLQQAPGLVGSGAIGTLKDTLAAAAAGRWFILQSGHGEEQLADVNPARLSPRLKAMDTLRRYLEQMLPVPVATIGLLAGNFARSSLHATEVVGELTVTSYYGDMVNARAAHPWGRRPDARRMLWAYEAGQMALATLGGTLLGTTHEAANLHFEAALVRQEPDGFYATSCHLLGLDDINQSPDSCHLEFCRGLRNPVSVRVGPDLAPARLQAICRTLNPHNEAGKLVLLTSLGSRTERLDALVEAVRALAMPVVWMCDPLRANTAEPAGLALRDAIGEMARTMARHAALGSRCAGLALDGAAAPALDFQRSLQFCSNLAHASRETQ